MGSDSLRSVINSCPHCRAKFKEAESAAKKVFKNCKCLPFYTVHDEKHSKKIEQYLNQMIWREGRKPHDDDFIPSPEEAAYLLSAAYMHDIGMWYGLIDKEKPEDLIDLDFVRTLRDTHEKRSSDYIIHKWKASNWEDQEKNYLANICVYHRRNHLLNEFAPYKTQGKHDKIRDLRLIVLAALLRLADACHIDKSRAPEKVMDLYISLGITTVRTL